MKTYNDGITAGRAAAAADYPAFRVGSDPDQQMIAAHGADYEAGFIAGYRSEFDTRGGAILASIRVMLPDGKIQRIDVRANGVTMNASADENPFGQIADVLPNAPEVDPDAVNLLIVQMDDYAVDVETADMLDLGIADATDAGALAFGTYEANAMAQQYGERYEAGFSEGLES